MTNSVSDLVTLIGQYGFMIVIVLLMLRGEILPKKSIEDLKEVFGSSTELLAKRLLEGMQDTIRAAVKDGVRDGLEEIVHRRNNLGGDNSN